MRKRLRVVLGLVVAAVLAVPVTVVGVHVVHPRDEDGYLAYLKRYGDPNSDAPLPVLPPAADLLAEGDAACDWMREQPYALWRTEPQYHSVAVHERYLQHIAGRSPSWGADPPEIALVVAGAWAHLCPADRELRQPRRSPFAPRPD
ncbi:MULTISPECIES: hypothetical protein [unclassified Micromonospora]|uniref:hypothetical protein n=1 Tax=unclassified Micromonospora TaxID=2617518 RepID=UPI003625189E